jgi:hypothetical protein
MARFGGILAAVALCGAGFHPASAQGFGRRSFAPVNLSIENIPYDGRFTFARLSYTVGGPGNPYYYRGLPPWAHGYDLAERNLMQILNSLSTAQPRLETGVVYDVGDPKLFKYPVAYMAEADFWELSDKDALNLRKYLEKGGFIIFDDFRDPGRFGGIGWDGFAANMRRILPQGRVVDLKPTDPIFHSFFEINSFNILPQAYDAGPPLLRGIYDDNDPGKRLLAMINFNTDISDYWEFAAQGRYPVPQDNEAYKLGVNYLIYSMSH